ncbi:flavin reductase family protein [Dactylosporangium vinaceum]|nr:flavin reductase family protein [Dactylosporangium vinaceum]UWZ42484.1 flavin reductase family protein [Dactylosporangium matsuzakiense]
MFEAVLGQRPAVSVASFRALMSEFPTGVSVVTALDDGQPRGMTCSSVCSVTIKPPTLLVCLRAASPTLDAVQRSGTFAVNLLHGKAQPTAELFASGDPDRFDIVKWVLPEPAGGPHLPEDAHTVADCRVSHTRSVGEHVVVFGEIFGITPATADPPLLYGRRQFATWADATP